MRNGSHKLVACVRALSFDETPTKLRLDETPEGSSESFTSSKPSLAKIMQSDASLTFVCEERQKQHFSFLTCRTCVRVVSARLCGNALATIVLMSLVLLLCFVCNSAQGSASFSSLHQFALRLSSPLAICIWSDLRRNVQQSLRRPPAFLRVPTSLQVLENATGDVLLKCITDIWAIPKFKELMRETGAADVTTTTADRRSANLRAESAARRDATGPRLELPCDVHKTSTVHGYTCGLSPREVSGIIHVSVAMCPAGMVAALRDALEVIEHAPMVFEVFFERLRCKGPLHDKA